MLEFHISRWKGIAYRPVGIPDEDPIEVEVRIGSTGSPQNLPAIVNAENP
jgi:hypothetical protein